MKVILLLLLGVIILQTHLYSQDPFSDFYYLDPLPNSKYVSKHAGIIIRPKSDVNINTILNSGSIVVQSYLFGNKNFTTKLAENNRIALLKFNDPFVAGDSILVTFTSNIKRTDGSSIDQFSYKFHITRSGIGKDDSFSIYDLYPEINSSGTPISPLSFGIPEISVTYSHFPSPGKIFLNNLVRNPSSQNTPYLLIIDNDGKPAFAREMPSQCYDLNMQPNGLLTYFDQNQDVFFAMNRSYEIVDTFKCGYGYITDLHELRILPNGNYLIMSYDIQIVDSIESKSPVQKYTMQPQTSNVVGVIVQELDYNDDVVFQWRSWDYFKITDATHENLNGALIDYCHANAIESDFDGNLMLSSRNMDEITKINRITGKTIWRLGGKNNEFEFINDTIGFSHQHAVRRIKNGNITLYDNGNFHVPPFSRAIEYKLDEVNKTATLVWQYRNNPDIYAPATGYVQRLPNNNTLICWGLTNPTLTEVRYDGTKVLEMNLPQGVFSYRAYRYEWADRPEDEILPSKFSLLQNYPNPFNPSTAIKFKIPDLGDQSAQVNAKLSVYDVSGKLVRVLVNENFPPGTYIVNFDGSSFSSGVYFYSLQAGNYSESRKMIMVK